MTFYASLKGSLESFLTVAESMRVEGEIDQLLITGHSLGGVLAEMLAARARQSGLLGDELRDITRVVTFASPGSRDGNAEVRASNFVGTDDIVPNGGPAATGARREGFDQIIDDGTLQRLDGVPLDVANQIEAHRLQTYIENLDALLIEVQRVDRMRGVELADLLANSVTRNFRHWEIGEDTTELVRERFSGSDAANRDPGRDVIFGLGGIDIISRASWR